MKKRSLQILFVLAMLPFGLRAQSAKPIEVPSGFTPNGDGMNDEFYVSSVKISTIDLKIFNRRNELIFQTTAVEPGPDGLPRSKGWDGTIGGIEQKMDSYLYILNATLIDGSKFEEKGSVTLMR